MSDIRVVVAIDFGTTYSGFAYANKLAPDNIETNTRWQGREGLPKTNTALLYDAACDNVLRWGEPALFQERRRRDREEIFHIIERFKLHLDDKMEQKPELPIMFDYKKAIIDYLIKMKDVIEETLDRRYPGLSLKQVLFVLTVPAEWLPETRAILRGCILRAGFIDENTQSNLEFTTEPEAAAIHCLSVCNEHNLKENDTFLVVDCGGGTVDLTVRTLLADNRLREETIRSGGLYGSTFVDEEFLKFLGRKVGIKALGAFREQAYGDLQKLVHRFFCQHVKLPFTGREDEFETIELDLEAQCSKLIPYITGEAKDKLGDEDWVIDIEYDDVKKMFKYAIENIIRLIEAQLNSLPRNKVKAMFLVGGFSESPYLIGRIREHFRRRVQTIAFPRQPIAAIIRGAVSYGLDMGIIESRVIPWSFGIEVKSKFDENVDPISLRNSSNDGMIWKIDLLVNKGERLKLDEERSKEYKPHQEDQEAIVFKVFYATFKNPRYSIQNNVQPLGNLRILLPDVHLGKNRPVKFSLKFAKEEIRATAINTTTRQIYRTTFKYPFESDF